MNLTVYKHLGAFYVTCFASVCEIFTAVVRELQRGPYVVLVFMPPHILYTGAVCSFFLIQTRKTDVTLIKKRRPSVFSNISIVAISLGLPVAVNIPVPASQVVFQKFRAIHC